MTLPVSGVEYSFTVQLVDSADPSSFLASPTIAAGDFKVSTDGGALADLTNLPTNSPSGSVFVNITLTAAEMTGAKINVVGVDVAGAEWEDVAINIDVPAGSVESVFDILGGDHTETSVRTLVRKKGTDDVLIDKAITGSLLSTGVTISTKDS